MAYAAGMSPADYEWYLKTAARHFWTGTIEQHLQWYKYEPTPGDYEASQQSVEELLDWADEKGWPGMRGVLLCIGVEVRGWWPGMRGVLLCIGVEVRGWWPGMRGVLLDANPSPDP